MRAFSTEIASKHLHEHRLVVIFNSDVSDVAAS
jgi:hypothetical protein